MFRKAETCSGRAKMSIEVGRKTTRSHRERCSTNWEFVIKRMRHGNGARWEMDRNMWRNFRVGGASLRGFSHPLIKQRQIDQSRRQFVMRSCVFIPREDRTHRHGLFGSSSSYSNDHSGYRIDFVYFHFSHPPQVWKRQNLWRAWLETYWEDC